MNEGNRGRTSSGVIIGFSLENLDAIPWIFLSDMNPFVDLIDLIVQVEVFNLSPRVIK